MRSSRYLSLALFSNSPTTKVITPLGTCICIKKCYLEKEEERNKNDELTNMRRNVQFYDRIASKSVLRLEATNQLSFCLVKFCKELV